MVSHHLKHLLAQSKDSVVSTHFDARREAVYAGVYQYQDNELITIIDDIYIPIFKLIENFIN